MSFSRKYRTLAVPTHSVFLKEVKKYNIFHKIKRSSLFERVDKQEFCLLKMVIESS